MSDTVDLDKIEALAKAATDGPWHVKTDSDCNPVDYEVWDEQRGYRYIAACIEQVTDAKFIAALNPAIVLQWVAETRELREHFTGWTEEIKHYTEVRRDRDALHDKLRVAVEALEFYARDDDQRPATARTALDEIKKLGK